MGCLYDYYRNVQEKQLRDELRLASYGVEAGGSGYLEQLASPYRFASVADCRLTWIAADGKVLFDTHVPAAEMENHSDRVEIREALAEGESEGVRYSQTLTERTLRAAAGGWNRPAYFYQPADGVCPGDGDASADFADRDHSGHSLRSAGPSNGEKHCRAAQPPGPGQAAGKRCL